MRILVTGANGFLGRELCNKLATNNVSVYGIVRNVKSVHDGLSNKVNLIECDLSKGINADTLPEKIDSVVHLAQSSLYRNFPDGMTDMLNVNIVSLVGLLEYARSANCKQFIYTSTGSVYGVDGQEHDEDRCVVPEGAYAITKYCAEMLMKPYSELFNSLIFRPYFIYGAGQENMLVSNLIDRVINAEPVDIQGASGGMQFCPTHVSDIADVIVDSIKKEVSGTFNLASPHQISIKEVVELIGENIGISPVLNIDESAKYAVFSPNLDKLSSWYDVTNKFRDFRSGLADVLS